MRSSSLFFYHYYHILIVSDNDPIAILKSPITFFYTVNILNKYVVLVFLKTMLVLFPRPDNSETPAAAGPAGGPPGV